MKTEPYVVISIEDGGFPSLVTLNSRWWVVRYNRYTGGPVESLFFAKDELEAYRQAEKSLRRAKRKADRRRESSKA